jgi:glycerophosphoryl diester phosphodiesterase
MPLPLLLQLALASRVLLDAHNCYPEDGRWADRIERALAQGVPIAIEQDLAWFGGKSILTHEKRSSGREPGMGEHFFERVRPIIEKELASGDRKRWPVIVLNLDFKTDEPEHHRAVWEILGKYEAWLTTAKKSSKKPNRVSKLDRKPILVLTGLNDVQQQTFHDAVPDGQKLRVFGAVTAGAAGTASATNYRRWSNNAWSVVEAGGQLKAGDWDEADNAKLLQLVKDAHKRGLWIRFYTLNGHARELGEANGWGRGYNFGSLEAAQKRWRAAIAAGVDFVATDQYEEFARELTSLREQTH